MEPGVVGTVTEIVGGSTRSLGWVGGGGVGGALNSLAGALMQDKTIPERPKMIIHMKVRGYLCIFKLMLIGQNVRAFKKKKKKQSGGGSDSFPLMLKVMFSPKGR